MLNGLKIYLRKGIFSDSGAGTFPLQLHISHSWEHTVQLFGDLRKRKTNKKLSGTLVSRYHQKQESNK